MNDNSFTPLSELGEFGLIKHLAKKIACNRKSTIKGIGDDAAVIDIDNDKYLLLTTDMLIEGIHFDITYTPLFHLGYKSVVVNLSDIYAMNGIPSQITFSFAVSNKYTKEAIDELYEGIASACQEYNVDLVGGDTSSSLKGMLISVTAIGECNKNEIIYRSTAKNNDLICVSGDLGAAYIGLQVLLREKITFTNNPSAQPNLKPYEYVIKKHLHPKARKDIIDELKSNNIKANSMIDISDGLASELLHLCEQSNLGCEIYDDKIPISSFTENTAAEFNINPLTCALNGGEDYELLFTVDLNDYEKIKDLKNISIIGYMTKKNKEYNLISGNQKISITAQGWDAFLKKNK